MPFPAAARLNDVDAVVHVRREEEDLLPSPEAHRYAEARRALETVMSLEKSGPLVDEATALLQRLP